MSAHQRSRAAVLMAVPPTQVRHQQGLRGAQRRRQAAGRAEAAGQPHSAACRRSESGSVSAQKSCGTALSIMFRYGPTHLCALVQSAMNSILIDRPTLDPGQAQGVRP